jgi:ribonuclease E
MVAIDVNSGRFTSESDPEDTAFRINSEAAVEIPRQLRLRDLGGVIVIDFIDMRGERNRKEIERIVFEELKKDRAKSKALRMSRFCLIEMTRQRMRASLRRASYEVCPVCQGQGHVQNTQSQALYVMRRLQWGLSHKEVHRARATVSQPVADYLHNRKRQELVSLENVFRKQIEISTNGGGAANRVELSFFNRNGQKVMIKC